MRFALLVGMGKMDASKHGARVWKVALGGRLRTRKDTLENVFPVVRRVRVWWPDVHAKEAFASSDERNDFNKLVEGLQFRMPDQNITQV